MVELHYAELQSKLPGELNCLYYSSSVLLDWMYAEFADGFGNGFRACMSLPVYIKYSSSTTILVDPASDYMLVSKIKPCMCKYKLNKSETANGSLNQL